jgi:hypothetical protein
MKTRVLMATVGAAAAALAASVMWTAPSASADTPYCDALPPSKFMSATADSTSPQVVRNFMIACMEMRLRPARRGLAAI